MARAYLVSGEAQQARDIIESIPEEKRADPDVQGVRAALELAGGGRADAKPLLEKLALHPEDHAARYELANALAARGELSSAVDHLLKIVEENRDWNDEAARKQLLKIFDAAGPASEVAKAGRRRLSALLFA
jgi:putative thioredoxin